MSTSRKEPRLPERDEAISLPDEEEIVESEREGLVVHDTTNSPGGEHLPTEPFTKPE